jgi:hypothetical protein
MLLFASISGVLVQPPSPRVDQCATRSWKRLRGGSDRRWRELRAAARPRVRTPPTLLCAPACRRKIEIRGAACFIGRHQDFRACPKALDRLAVDQLPGGNHRRGRAGATPGGGAYGAYRMRDQRRRGVGPGNTDDVGAAHTSRPFASERFSPRALVPAAPLLPAQPAIRRNTRRENGPSLRRSPPPATAGQH